MALTHLKIVNLVTRNRRYEVLDENGLYVRVMPTGRKYWDYRYQFDGKPRRMTLGVFPVMGLSDARIERNKAFEKVQKGIDPGMEKQEIKADRKAAPTFAELLQEYWDVCLCKRKAGAATKRLIEHDAIPAWGNWKVKDITRRDVVRLKDKVDARAPVTANRLIGALSTMFNNGIRRGVLENNPCLMIERSEEKARDRVLSDHEVRLLWTALDIANKKIDLFRATKLVLKMILLSGQRPGEVCGMQWNEIDEDSVWNIPGERMKNGEPQQIPFTPLMLGVLDRAKEISHGKQFVFASSHHDDASLTTRAISRAVARHYTEMGIEKPFTPHDIRRTLRTKLAEIGVEDHIAERIMGHKLQGVLGIYNRYSYLDEKRTALIKWESHLRWMVGMDVQETTGKVIALNSGKR